MAHTEATAITIVPHGSAQSPYAFSTGVLKRQNSFGAVTPSPAIPDMPSMYGEEEKCPKSLKGKDRWEWKLRQLTFQAPLAATRKLGRERETAVTYANDADAACVTKMGGALREKRNRHEDCELLALGGFLMRDLPTVKENLIDMQRYVGGWSPHSQKARHPTLRV